MKGQEVRDMNDRERAAKLGEVKENLFRLRFQLASGQTDALKKYRALRKDRARLLTVAKEQGDDPAVLHSARPGPAGKKLAPRKPKAAAKKAVGKAATAKKSAAKKTAPKKTAPSKQ